MEDNPNSISRRTLLRGTTAIGASAFTLMKPHLVRGAGKEKLRAGIVGCGGRGTQAVVDTAHRQRERRARGHGRCLRGPPGRLAPATARPQIHRPARRHHRRAGRPAKADERRGPGGVHRAARQGPAGISFCGLRRLSEAGEVRYRYRDADHASGLPAHSLRGGGRGRQARFHRKADRHRRHRGAALHGGGTQGRGKETDRHVRRAAARRQALHGDACRRSTTARSAISWRCIPTT